jgi:NADPH:quinone reductase-like Zn-dependent oxidoreductase
LLKSLGVDHIINYNEDQHWGQTARQFTPNGEGFDHVIDVGGTDTLYHSVQAVRHEGVITVIGLLTGVDAGKANVLDALVHICTFRGIHIGSKDQMQEMMAAIEANGIQPVLDKRVFKLDELREGLEYLVSIHRLLRDKRTNASLRKPESMSAKLWLKSFNQLSIYENKVN